MSIITNALKKAQERRTTKETTSSTNNVSDFMLKNTVTSETNERENIFIRTFQRKPVFITGIFVMLFFLAFAWFFLLSRRSPQIETDIAVQDTVKTTLPNKPTASRPQKPIVQKGITLPFLNGIMYSPTSPYAIIDGQMVSEGETINGYTVTMITPDSVTLTSRGKEIKLNLQ